MTEDEKEERIIKLMKIGLWAFAGWIVYSFATGDRTKTDAKYDPRCWPYNVTKRDCELSLRMSPEEIQESLDADYEDRRREFFKR